MPWSKNQISSAAGAIHDRKAHEARQYTRIQNASINNINSQCNYLHIGGKLDENVFKGFAQGE